MIHSQMILTLESFPTSRADIFSLITVSQFVFCKSTRGTKCFPTLLTLDFWFRSSRSQFRLSLQLGLRVFLPVNIVSTNRHRTTTIAFHSWGIRWPSFLQTWCWWHDSMHWACIRLGSICGILNMKCTSSVSPQYIHHSVMYVVMVHLGNPIKSKINFLTPHETSNTFMQIYSAYMKHNTQANPENLTLQTLHWKTQSTYQFTHSHSHKFKIFLEKQLALRGQQISFKHKSLSLPAAQHSN